MLTISQTAFNIIVTVIGFVAVYFIKENAPKLWEKYKQLRDVNRTYVITNGQIYKGVALLSTGLLLVGCFFIGIVAWLAPVMTRDMVGNAMTQKQTSEIVTRIDTTLRNHLLEGKH